MSSSSSSSYGIQEIVVKKKRVNWEEGKKILQSIADHVLPITHKRKWLVKKLEEFFPKSANLLGMNVNRGKVIYIRLRPARSPSTFYPYNHLIGTMLHELEIGPHNQAFQNMLNELWNELETLISRNLIGNIGVLFQDAGKGHVLGGNSLITRATRETAAAAAEKRKKYNSLVGNVVGGYRLGGENYSKKRKLSAKELKGRILQAAENRRQLNEECLALMNGIDLNDDEVGHLKEVRLSKQDSKRQGECKIRKSSTTRQDKSKVIDIEENESKSMERQWNCSVCTYLNEKTATQCCVCDTIKESPQRPNQLHWECGQCRVVHSTSVMKCSECLTLRENAVIYISD